ncbi:unnamed protein product [Symbiodinium sp. CCMP2456]|nr:unnamed protein product [Symbiodinium sp. CCMP2456]
MAESQQGIEDASSKAVTTNAERMYDRMCSRADGGKRLAKRQTYLLSMNDLIEEQILEIETERALHSDLKPEEREVMGAFVVFWCQRTRDAVLGQYGWSRLKLPFEDQGQKCLYVGTALGVAVLEAFPLIVEATQDPSLQLWQNMDVKPFMRLAMGCVMSICRFLVFNLIFIVACITMSTHIYYPLFLPIDAKVWLITNVSEPVVSSSDDAGSPGLTSLRFCLLRLSFIVLSNCRGLCCLVGCGPHPGLLTRSHHAISNCSCHFGFVLSYSGNRYVEACSKHAGQLMRLVDVFASVALATHCVCY